MLTQPTGMLWAICPLHEFMGNMAMYFGVTAHGCVDGGMGGPLCIPLWWSLKKKAPEAALSDPPWLSDLETSQAELWILSSQIRLAVILSFFFFSFKFFYMTFLTASKWTAWRLEEWEFTLRCILTYTIPLSCLVDVWKRQPSLQTLFMNFIHLQQWSTNTTN